MFKSVGPIETHQVEHFEELLQMHVLLSANHIYHLVELVLLVALDGPRDVSSQVDGRAIYIEYLSLNIWL